MLLLALLLAVPTLSASTGTESRRPSVPASVAEPSAPRATSPADLPRACQGALLKLDTLVAQTACYVPESPSVHPSPSALELKVVPAILRVRSGGSVDFSVRMTNPTAHEVRFYLDVSCPTQLFSEEAYDAAGKRVDRVGNVPPIAAANYECGKRVCRTRTLRVALSPHGAVVNSCVL